MTYSEKCVMSILRNEGFRPMAYTDQYGLVTIGHGIRITTMLKFKLIPQPAIAENKEVAANFVKNLYLTRNLSELIVRYILTEFEKEFTAKLVAAGYYPQLWPQDAWDILMEMAYQMGVGEKFGKYGVLGFKNVIRLVNDSNFKAAADAMLDSKWAREDTKPRATTLAERMRKIY
jgi:GH24 family phage-related lysozyme (muramidase)